MIPKLGYGLELVIRDLTDAYQTAPL